MALPGYHLDFSFLWDVGRQRGQHDPEGPVHRFSCSVLPQAGPDQSWHMDTPVLPLPPCRAQVLSSNPRGGHGPSPPTRASSQPSTLPAVRVTALPGEELLQPRASFPSIWREAQARLVSVKPQTSCICSWLSPAASAALGPTDNCTRAPRARQEQPGCSLPPRRHVPLGTSLAEPALASLAPLPTSPGQQSISLPLAGKALKSFL